MAAVDNLPGDQHAVLQLVLGRGRSYDDIARLLSIKPDAVRERAVAALDALGPQTGLDQQARTQICDYLLGQLPESEIEGVRGRLATSANERAWARVVSSELTSVASHPLPDIPPEASSPPPPPAPAAGPPEPEAEADADGGSRHGRPQGEPRPPPDPGAGPRSSRLGGLIVIGLVVAIIVVGVIVLVSGGSTKHANTVAATPTTSTPQPGATTPATSSTTAAATASSGTSTTKVLAQINLTPPTAASKAAGIAEVLREGTTNGIAIVAQNVTPNTTKPPNAYAVWLYNSPTDAKILGFVNPGVPASGKLSTAGGLPATASHYKQLIVTLETSAKPKAPGTIILQGAVPRV